MIATRDYKIIIALADLHIGIRHVSAASMKQQLKDHFFRTVEAMNPVDLFAVCGDLFHTILSLNSEYSELFHWFIDRLYRLAKKKGAAIIIVKGTLSHDNDQLNNIRSYVKNTDGVDFRIYDTVTEDTIWDNYKFLVLPDVRVKQLKDVGKYLKTPGAYDFILGHGTVSQLQFIVQESENQPTKTYVYDANELAKTSRGPVLFGHIHQFQRIGGKFCYVGPFTMLERGNVDAGFVVVGIYDKDRTKFRIEHYVNPDSADYIEMKITAAMIREIPVDDLMAAIDDIAADAKQNDLITLRIIRGDDREAADKVMLLENRYRGDPRFSIKKKIKNKKEEAREERQRERRERYGYLLSSEDELAEILYRYYLDDVKPTLPDQRSREANLTREDFDRALGADRSSSRTAREKYHVKHQQRKHLCGLRTGLRRLQLVRRG